MFGRGDRCLCDQTLSVGKEHPQSGSEAAHMMGTVHVLDTNFMKTPTRHQVVLIFIIKSQ